MQTIETVQAIVDRITYPMRGFLVERNGNGMYVQVAYHERDVTDPRGDAAPLLEQRGRKWIVSPFATDSEIFQTCLAAALASAEHQVREHFLVDGQAVYGPHMDVNALVGLLEGEDATDARKAA